MAPQKMVKRERFEQLTYDVDCTDEVQVRLAQALYVEIMNN